MTSRRHFLSTAGGLVALPFSTSLRVYSGLSSGPTSKASYRYADIAARIAHGRFDGITKQDLPTPALLLDQEAFESNIQKMAAHFKSSSIHFRPHTKVHKSPEIARRQVASGAVGVCCATIAECELMIATGIHGVLWTCQPASRVNISRTIELCRKDLSFMCVVDDPMTVQSLNEAAEAARLTLGVVVDVDIGLQRQGVQPGEPALQLVQKVTNSKNLHLAGLMGYSGAASHTKGWQNRKKRSAEDLQKLAETVHLCRRNGIPVGIVTGGSTGTYDIDSQIEGLTEMQVGPYVVMDTIYRAIGSSDGSEQFDDFHMALSVLSTVVSKTRSNCVTIDAGNKAMARDTDEVKNLGGVKFAGAGAEYGMLKWEDGERDLKLGDRVELFVSNIDMSVNVFDRMFVCRGEQLVDIFPVMGRSGAAQR